MSGLTRKTLRDVFKSKLRLRLYQKLGDYPVIGSWEAQERFNVAASIVKAHDADIEDYLDTHKVPLSQIENAVNAVLEKFLIPDIENITL